MATNAESGRGQARLHRYSPELTLIVLEPPIAGFGQFIGVWLYQGACRFLVDVGPAVTVPALVMALERLNATHLDFILLTHIHIDHAGGLGDLAPLFPGAAIVCHPGGIEHLVDPARLWQGSLKILGDTARAYGPMKPIPPRRLQSSAAFKAPGITAVATPGHAPHHLSFLAGDTLFAGEAAGVHLVLPDGGDYLRPATPPRFFMPTAQASLDCLLALRPERICYGHLGMWPEAPRWLERHRQQLWHWERILRQEMGGLAETAQSEACIDRLLAADPLLAGFGTFSAEVQQRERGFMRNSVRGFLGWLATA